MREEDGFYVRPNRPNPPAASSQAKLKWDEEHQLKPGLKGLTGPCRHVDGSVNKLSELRSDMDFGWSSCLIILPRGDLCSDPTRTEITIKD